jgi:hypothetical protein
MTELVRVPLGGGECIIAEVDELDISRNDVVLAALEPGKTVTEMKTRLETGLRSIGPAVTELVSTLKAASPDSIGVEFGIKVGGETGVILAKGTAEVNFKVVMEWKPASRRGTSRESTRDQ